MHIKKKIISKNQNIKIYEIEFINDNGYKFKFLNFGCYIQSIKIPYPTQKNKTEDVILGYTSLYDIVNDQSYFNATIGRVAGRISNSSFLLNKRIYKLNSNDKKNHLHGGKKGFNKRIWKVVQLKKNNYSSSCTMNYKSTNLEEGYPGNLNCYTEYKLNNKNQIIINYKIFTDKDTILNLTNHNYWNFNGHKKYYTNISNHILSINAKKYCEINKYLLPTGKILKSEGTKFDFLKFKEIGSKILRQKGIDNYFVLNSNQNKLNKLVELYSPSTKMGMKLFSNQPGFQFYTGNNMKKNYKGKHGRCYGKYYGLCLEPQKYPNAINTKKFSSIILKKNSIYKSTIKFCLKNDY